MGGEQRRETDPEKLAPDKTGHYAEGDRGTRRAREELPVDAQPRIGEREQGHDDEAGPRMERVLEPFVPGDGAQHAQTRGTGKLGSGLFAKEAGDGGWPFDTGAPGPGPAPSRAPP